MLFQEYRGRIYIFGEDETLLFSSSLEEFLQCEPTYQAASAPIRCWNAEGGYLSDGHIFDDTFYTQQIFNLITSKILTYQKKLEIFRYTHNMRKDDLLKEDFTSTYTQGELL
jgi:hypothetical protein